MRHFSGRLKPLKGRRRDEREEGAAAAAAASYISQCTQRTGHLIYIEPHWFLTQCGVRCGSCERWPTIQSGGEYGSPRARRSPVMLNPARCLRV